MAPASQAGRERADSVADLAVDDDEAADRWAWVADAAGAEAEPVPLDLSSCTVTAILVTLDAEQWLPDSLAALSRLRRKPNRIIAVDNGSVDATPELLDRAHRHGVLDEVIDGPELGGFGAGIDAAIEFLAAKDPAPAAASDAAVEEWLWLLHDDAVPEAETLERLLSQVVNDPSIDITGPKLVFPRRRHGAGHQLSEVGVTVSGTGRRDLGFDLGEIDQGQHDQPRQHLGVSTCGMLIRLADWQELGGFDPAMPCFRDGVELGWRATEAGLRVVNTPSARMVHRQVGRAGLRPRGAGGRQPARLDQRLGSLVVAGHARGWRFGLVWLRLMLDCLLRALGYCLGKAPARARDELSTFAWLLTSVGELRAYRGRVRLDELAGDRRAQRQLVRTLRPPWWSGPRLGLEAVAGTLSTRYRDLAGDGDAVSLDELTGDDFAAQGVERQRSRWQAPAVIVGVLLLAASLLAARSLFGLGQLAAPALLPAPEQLAELWQRVVDPIPGAVGAVPPPWLLLQALGSTLLVGQPDWLIAILLLGVVPLSYLAIYPLLRSLIAERRIRVCAASAYALLPVLLGGVNQGRLSVSVFALTLPALVQSVRLLVHARPRDPEAWRGGWATGMLLLIMSAFEPAILIPAVLAGIVGAICLRRTPAKVARIGIALGLPVLFWGPWWRTLLMSPGRLLTGPDPAAIPAGAAPEAWQLALGREVGAGLPPLWLGSVLFGLIWLGALIALARRPRRLAVWISWATAMGGLLCAVLLSRVVVAVPPLDTAVRPWTGAYLLLAFAALLIAMALGVDGLRSELRDRSFGWRQPASLGGLVLACLLVVAAAGWWVWAGVSGPLHRDRGDELAPYLLNAMQSDSRTRVLAVDLGDPAAGPVRYSVIYDDQIRLGDAERGFAYAAAQEPPELTADLVQRLIAGTADAAIVPQLRELGIGYIWASSASTEEIARISNTPGLGTASGTPDTTVWQVLPAVTRISVAEPDSVGGPTSVPSDNTDNSADRNLTGVDTLPPVISPGAADRQLRLGEAADPRWQASVDGASLAPGQAGWQQAFTLPVSGGTVLISFSYVGAWLLLGQGVILLIGLIFAVPGIRRPDLRDPVRAARRAAFVEGRAQ